MNGLFKRVCWSSEKIADMHEHSERMVKQGFPFDRKHFELRGIQVRNGIYIGVFIAKYFEREEDK